MRTGIVFAVAEHNERPSAAFRFLQLFGHGVVERIVERGAEFVPRGPSVRPSTGRTSGACPGYVIDHVVPLKRGGADAPSNMQWQTEAAATANAVRYLSFNSLRAKAASE